MDEEYVKDMLEDIRNLAEHQNFGGIIAMCENEIEELERLEKQEIISTVRLIECAKYEIAKLRHDDTDDLYKMLNDASKILRNLVNKKELNIKSANENV